MKIVVASGKGGTGKTLVAINLALSVEADQVLDCDVEEPNDYIFIKPSDIVSEYVELLVPKIDESKCNYCRKCAEFCQFNALFVAGETAMVFPELCHSCGGCMAVCPENAIAEKGRELGVIQKGRRNGIEFIHGKLRVGEAMSPPLIRKVLSYCDDQKLTLVDAPPGTSCPVIESMKPADFVVLVTEPTPFGLHDLKLAVGAVDILGIPRGLVINRSDLGDDRVREYADQVNLPILMEIPFDRKIAEAYARGAILVDVMPEWKERFLELYEKIQRLTNKSKLERPS